MLLMNEAGIRGGMCQSIHRYAKANNKYLKSYEKSIESSYLMYLDPNILYGWAMCQTLPINGFKWEDDLSRFNERFIKNYNENSNEGYFLEVDVEYPKKISGRKKLEKVEKLVSSIEDKEKYFIHIRALKQALNHGLILKRVQSNSI